MDSDVGIFDNFIFREIKYLSDSFTYIVTSFIFDSKITDIVF